MPPFLAYIILLVGVLCCIGIGYLITQLGTRNCNLDICKKHGKLIYDGLNETLDPCDDFYEYVCSNFLEYGQILKGEIDENSYRLLANYLSPKLNFETDGKVAQIAKMIYQPCVKEPDLESQGMGPLERTISKLGSIPFLDGNWNKEREGFFRIDSADVRYIDVGLFSPFFDMKIVRLKESHIKLSIPKYLLSNFKPDPKSWVEFCENFVNYWNRLKLLNGTLTKEIKKDIILAAKLKSDVLNTIKFSTNCSRASYKFIDVTQFNVILNLQVKNVDLNSWLGARDSTVIDLFNHPAIFEGEFESYIRGLINLLNKPQNTPRVIATWLGIECFITIYPLMPKRFRELAEMHLLPNENQTTITTYRIYKDRQLLCAKIIHDILITSLSNQYMTDVQPPISAEANHMFKVQMTKTMNNIKETVMDMTWIEESDKDSMLDILQNITSSVPLPDSVFEDMQDQAGFEYIFMKYCGNEEGTLETWLSVRKAFYERLTGGSETPNSIYLRDPEYDAFGTDLFYDQERTAIVPALPFVTYPAFSHKWPKDTNYAGLGVWIAQRIFRDVLGHKIPDYFPEEIMSEQYGPISQKSDDVSSTVAPEEKPLAFVYSNETDSQYRARRLCIFNEYNEFLKSYNTKSNDPNCLEDTVAFAGAVQAAYNAYKDYTKNRFFFEAKLPYLKRYNTDQYFFVKFASTFCVNKDNKLNITSDGDRHVPRHYTVLATLKNFPKFAEVFKCKPGSNMHPARKCLLWRN